MIVHGNARERGHRLGLRAACDHHQFLRIETAKILRTDDAAVWHAQFAQTVRDFDIVHHAAAHETDFASDHAGDIDYLLDAVNGTGEAGDENFGRRGAE